MARPKGSKNAVRTKKANVDYSAIVAEKTTAKEQIETEIAALSDNISVLKEQLKSKKSALKVAVKELSKAEAKKVAGRSSGRTGQTRGKCKDQCRTQSVFRMCCNH